VLFSEEFLVKISISAPNCLGLSLLYKD